MSRGLDFVKGFKMSHAAKLLIALTLAAGLLALPVPAQQRGTATAARGAPTAQAPATYRAPRTADGRPDLNGIWQALDGPNWDLEPHAAGFGSVPQLGAINAIPPGMGVVENGPIPYRPSALAQRAENFKNRTGEDPEAKCYLPGVPRAMYLPQPFQVVQSRDHIMMVFQYAGAVRTINMTDHKEAPAPSWMGWSNGHWEGETLVIETTSLDDRTWFDRAGNYHSDELKVTERIFARSPDTLNYEATIDDPKVFTRTWKISLPLYRRVERNAQIMEFKCVEFAEELLYGHLRKQPAAK
jgi:hypothetical protein